MESKQIVKRHESKQEMQNGMGGMPPGSWPLPIPVLQKF
jgi:hypothetical protein